MKYFGVIKNNFSGEQIEVKRIFLPWNNAFINPLIYIYLLYYFNIIAASNILHTGYPEQIFAFECRNIPFKHHFSSSYGYIHLLFLLTLLQQYVSLDNLKQFFWSESNSYTRIIFQKTLFKNIPEHFPILYVITL